jgi:drug/metabolite transporter (DMT)-like permease
MRNAYYIGAALAVVFTAAGQILIKLGSRNNQGKGIVRLYMNACTTGGFALLLATTVINQFVFSYFPLKITVVLLPATIMTVFFLSALVLHEEVNRRQGLGVLIMIIGVVLYSA